MVIIYVLTNTYLSYLFIYFPGERSESGVLGAAGKKMGDFKAEMAYFTSKWGTRVVYG